jgi:two-component system NtrC family sensor kinase
MTLNESTKSGQEKAASSLAREWREDHDRLQAIMDNCTACIYVKDIEGRYLFVNRQFETLFRISRQNLIGLTDVEIFPALDAASYRTNDLQVLKAGKPMEWEETAPHPDGPHDYVSLKFPMRDPAGKIYGLCGISTDITEFKRIQQERDQFFNVTLDMLGIADFNGYFRQLNPSWERTLGWTTAELMAKPYIEFVHPEDRASTIAEAQKLQGGGNTISFENRYLCADGSCKWLLWNATPIPNQQLIYAAARDITGRKDDEKKLAETAAELRKVMAAEREVSLQFKKAQGQLMQAEKMVALGQMVAGVAHEINNPLSFVNNNMAVLERDLGILRELLHRYQEAEQTLGRPEAFQKVHEYADEIDAPYTLANLDGIVARSKEGLKRIQHIVGDLREFARDSDKDWHEVDLNAGIESTLNIVQLRAARKKVLIETTLGPLPRVKCHPAKINQVVMNLVANAIDACKEGGQVQVVSRLADSHVEIHIIDNGCGINPAIRDKIFDPFFTTKAPGMGTGLGLSISHSIVEAHGGRIEMKCPPAGGAHFTVVLPVRSTNA